MLIVSFVWRAILPWWSQISQIEQHNEYRVLQTHVTVISILLNLGQNPQKLRGRKIGVYVGCSGNEAYQGFTSDTASISGHEMVGCQSTMRANRVSFFMNFTGN